ncbi:hypothetical protein B0T16DRAFT_405429 [Cercophora newfieldiana]|uniref:Uncharacterized protein n=1 Tax=Cercophora newfieldiana TaxID=92897 RepID=A0AA40CVG5_9PEZI|nr:hypothetical protein B0T16DRAFT_405429 [Cercophora newfieldiana]
MSKTVKFRRESPSEGSYLDHQRSDSGVGSFSSDNESRTAYPDRSAAGAEYDTSLYSLLAAETTKKNEWMDRANKLDELLIRAHKELKETQARLRGLEDHVEELEEEKTKLSKQNQTLTERNQRLEDELKDSRESKESKDAKRASRRKSNSPPSMSGAIPATSAAPVDDKSKPRRSASRRHSIGRERDDERMAIERERERISREMDKERRKEEEREKDKEMDRLRSRFASRAAGDESDANSSKTSSKSKGSHRSYVEPLGQGAPRPTVQGAKVMTPAKIELSKWGQPMPPFFPPSAAPDRAFSTPMRHWPGKFGTTIQFRETRATKKKPRGAPNFSEIARPCGPTSFFSPDFLPPTPVQGAPPRSVPSQRDGGAQLRRREPASKALRLCRFITSPSRPSTPPLGCIALRLPAHTSQTFVRSFFIDQSSLFPRPSDSIGQRCQTRPNRHCFAPHSFYRPLGCHVINVNVLGKRRKVLCQEVFRAAAASGTRNLLIWGRTDEMKIWESDTGIYIGASFCIDHNTL